MPLVGILALLAFGAAFTCPGIGAAGLKQIAVRFITILALNAGSVAIYVVADQLLLNHLGFIELPILVSIDLGMLLISYVVLAAILWTVVPSIRDSRMGFLAGARLLLPLLVIGVIFARHHVLSYCASGWPADPRCEAVWANL